MTVSVYGDVAPYTGYLYSTTKLVNTNYTDYLGFTIRYRLDCNTGD
jgi:hypothetical protein